MIANPEIALTEAIAEKFEVPVEDFLVFPVEELSGRAGLAIAYAARVGLERGSWNQIFAKDSRPDYTVIVDGLTFDTRTGMTRAAYQALQLKMASQKADSLPDVRSGGENDQSWTYLTGEKARFRVIPVAGVYCEDTAEGQKAHANFSRRSRKEGYHNARFRPAVIL